MQALSKIPDLCPITEFSLTEEQIAEAKRPAVGTNKILEEGIADSIYVGRSYRYRPGEPDLARHVNDFLSRLRPRL